MKSKLYRIFRFLLLLFQIHDVSAAWFLSKFHSNLLINDKANFESGKLGFLFKDSGLTLSKLDFEKWGGDYNKIARLVRKLQFLSTGNATWIVYKEVNNKQIKFNVKTFDNLFVLHELFVEKLYDINIDEVSVVIDIGMNVGLASLYFSSFDNVAKVYSFEPFRDTYDEAINNFSLNDSEFSRKISSYNEGVGDSDRTISIPKPPPGDLGGSTTDYYLREMNIDLKESASFIDVKIISIENVIKQVRQEMPLCKIIVKLDCEGAEFEIIQKLDQLGMIRKISVFIIEWHFRDKKILTDILSANHFNHVTLGRSDVDVNVGMIYAFNKN